MSGPPERPKISSVINVLATDSSFVLIEMV
jgi:hypothetical protein